MNIDQQAAGMLRANALDAAASGMMKGIVDDSSFGMFDGDFRRPIEIDVFSMHARDHAGRAAGKFLIEQFHDFECQFFSPGVATGEEA